MATFTFSAKLDGKNPVHVIVRGTEKTITKNVVDAERHAIAHAYKVTWTRKRATEWEGIARPARRST